MYFANYGLRNTSLDKRLENPLSDDLSRSNMVNGSKHCCNMDDRAFTIFIDCCEHNIVGKSLF